MSQENKHTKLLQELLNDSSANKLPDGVSEAMMQDAEEGYHLLEKRNPEQSVQRINQHLQAQIRKQQSKRKQTFKFTLPGKNWVTITIFIVLIIVAIMYILHITP